MIIRKIRSRRRPRLVGVLFGTLSALCLAARAEVLTLQWDPSPSSSVTKYRVYDAPNSSSPFSPVLTTTTTQASLSSAGSFAGHRLYVTALTDAGLESDPSNTVQVGPSAGGSSLAFNVGSGGKLSLSWSGTGYVVQTAPAVTGPWTALSSASPTLIDLNDRSVPARFFRLVK